MTKEQNSRRGRPCVDDENRKTGAPLFINLNKADRQKVDAITQATGEKKTALFRRLIDDEARRVALDIADAENLRRETPTENAPDEGNFDSCFDFSTLNEALDQASADFKQIMQAYKRP